MPKRAKEKVEPSRFFQKGDSFMLAVDILMTQQAPSTASSGFAMVTCAAFGCEVYLKVLAMLEHGQQPLETHNLRFLFQDLRPETQARVRDKWERDVLPGIRKGWDNPARPREIVIPESFDQALDLSSRAFIDWRYTPPENKALHFHMMALPEILRPLILAIQPDFGRLQTLTRWDQSGRIIPRV